MPKKTTDVSRYYAISDLQWTDSDYLCLFCYEPLYYNVNTKKEICTNPSCFISQTYPKIFVNIDKNPLLDKMKQKYLKRIKRFYIFAPDFLFRRLYETRMIEFIKFFHNTGMKFNDILAIDFLLTKLHFNKIWGLETNEDIFQNALNEFYDDFVDMKFIENVESKLYLIDQNHIPYILKYEDVIADIHKVLGLVDGSRYGPEDVNSFYFIDSTARVGQTKGPFDIEVLFKNHFNLVITLNHIFKFGYFISRIHDYPAKTRDLAVLFSIWTTCQPGKTCSLNQDGLRQIFDGALKKNNLEGDFNEFLETYTSGKQYSPILVFDGQNFHYDYASLFLILFFLFSKNKTAEGTQTLSGFNTMMEQRQKAAHNFEVEIRKKFRNEGFTVFPQNDEEKFEPSVNGQRREFDCIAIDYIEKIIISVDAKYEDIAPSSKVGETILEQSVLDKRNGILKHAKEHHTRRRFLIKNFNILPLDLKGDFWRWKIFSIVITKHKSMISKHKTSEIISFDDFKNTDFRNL